MKQAVKESMPQIKQVVQQTKQVAETTIKSAKPAIQEYKNMAVATSQTVAQQELLINKIKEIKQIIATDEKISSRYKMSKEELLQFRAELEKYENQLKKLQKEPSKFEKENSKSFDNAGKTIKKFVFRLLSVASIYSLISRSMQSYLAIDDKARAKSELTSNVIGNMLAPAMNVLLDMIQYVIIGVALLIKMFTGFDALASITTKNIKNATKATKEFNREITTMDEITNISGKNTGTGFDLTADFSALEEFNKKILEVQQLFDKWEVQKLVDKLKDLWDWAVKNKDSLIKLGIELGIIFGIAKITQWVSNIGKLIGVGGSAATAGSGLMGILSSLSLLGQFAVLAISVSIIVSGISQVNDALKKLNELKAGAKATHDGNATKLNELLAQYENLKRTKGLTKEQQNAYNMLLEMKKEYEGKGYSFGGAWANGYVATSPTLGLVAEYSGAKTNPEIISPRSIMYETMLDAFGAIMPSMQGGAIPGDVVFNINSKEFARLTYEDYQNEAKRVGKSTIIRRA